MGGGSHIEGHEEACERHEEGEQRPNQRRSHPRLLVGDGAARTSTAWTCTGCSYENDKDDFLACEMCGTERPSAAGHGSIEEETIAQREALATAASLQLAKRLEEKEREAQEARNRQIEADEAMATKEHNSMDEEAAARREADALATEASLRLAEEIEKEEREVQEEEHGHLDCKPLEPYAPSRSGTRCL